MVLKQTNAVFRGFVRSLVATTVALGAFSAPSAAQTIIGPEASACAPGARGPAALVRVYGFKDRGGNLRVQLYSDNPDEFLEKGKKLKRIELPMTGSGDMNVCMALPRHGEFSMAVLHDRDTNGKLSISKDGVGFSGNPKLGLSKPDYEDAMFVARDGVTVVDVILNYRQGLLSVKPLVARRD
ncbi:hypothetical protein SmB9_34980 [Sphingosinicella microcystinivorans]|uniref:Uncharacterized protein (DUF2141 family) n=1 Tax=Sphingosinicella microcystinivorans TaxID=335406 RepID=A0AAD1D8Y8_SPHMI|nr:uncharacterized protein (DUF2141 family) [Sphingosinicella microcystinivorans]BBE35840.1 hypothetical protein SmB9_34980 [Sphingosinicella microcystinivorans]